MRKFQIIFGLFLILGGGVFFFYQYQANASTQTREWTETRDGIFVFTDRLDENLSEKQYQFAGEHFIGSIAIIKDRVDIIRSFNPNFIVLQYFLGQGTGEATTNILGNDWINVWDDIKDQDECFYTIDTSSHPKGWVLETDWNWYLADIDSACWLNFVTSEVTRRIGDDHFDGVFLDSTSEPGYPWDPEIWWPTGEWEDGEPEYLPFWNPKLTRYFEYIYNYFSSLPRPHFVIPNVGHHVMVFSDMEWDNTDGIFIEGFARWREGTPFNLHDWKLQMNRVLNYVSTDKVFIGHSYTTRTNLQDRMFVFGSFMLSKGNHSYISISMEDNFQAEWYPEYEIDLGAYEDLPDSLEELAIPNDLYMRKYQKGVVIVNPHDESKYFNQVPNRMYKIHAEGGGEIWDNGAFEPGVLTYEIVERGFDIEPYSSVILMYNEPEQEVLLTPSRMHIEPYYAYYQSRLNPEIEQKLAVKLKQELETVFGEGQIGMDKKYWPTFVNAYVYGGYSVKDIAQTVRHGGKTVHPTIPWRFFKETEGYKNYESLGWLDSYTFPDGDYAYGKEEYKSLNDVTWLAESLASELRKHDVIVPLDQWGYYVNAYMYGGYPTPAIIKAIRYGGKTVHATMPWEFFKHTDGYKEYMKKP